MTRRRPSPADEEGMTLVEVVIAILIMGIAVVTIIGAITTLMIFTQEHRGHAVAETASRSFGQAVEAMAQDGTSLASTASGNSLNVVDASLLPRPYNSSTYVAVGRETVRVTAISGNTLTVNRNVNNDTGVQVSHPAGTRVVPILMCPEPAQLTPPAGSYTANPAATSTVTAIDYWSSSTGGFVNRSTCVSDYELRCGADQYRPECGIGYFRVSIGVTTTNDARYRGVDTVTRVLVRQGSA